MNKTAYLRGYLLGNMNKTASAVSKGVANKGRKMVEFAADIHEPRSGWKNITIGRSKLPRYPGNDVIPADTENESIKRLIKRLEAKSKPVGTGARGGDWENITMDIPKPTKQEIADYIDEMNGLPPGFDSAPKSGIFTKKYLK